MEHEFKVSGVFLYLQVIIIILALVGLASIGAAIYYSYLISLLAGSG